MQVLIKEQDESLKEDQPLSVKEVAYQIKSCVESNFFHVKVQGEISGYKPHSSGHHYFALKDDDAILDAICWRGTKLSIPIQEGQEVVALGRVTTYPMRSKYQMIVEEMLPKGQGALQALLKERMAFYKSKGYFDQKRPLPRFPKVIGVVTSETGAVIRDILHRISDRFPVSVILWPVLVQGVGAKEQIAKAIRGFNALSEDIAPKPDVLIVGRGGGSLEDLWAFNEPEVLEAAFQSQIPIISAVGHETDITLLDYVADKRAPTPTGAAEIAVPSRLDLLQDLGQWHSRLLLSTTNFLKQRTMRMQGMNILSPQKIVENWMLRLSDLSERLTQSMRQVINNKKMQGQRFSDEALYLRIKHIFERKNQQWTMYGSLLDQTSIEKTLQRGFCIPIMSTGSVARFDTLHTGTPLDLKFYEGIKKAQVV
jgi:exodeoxyribonuclease VII large subunit